MSPVGPRPGPEPTELREMRLLVAELKVRSLTDENRLYKDILNSIGKTLALAMSNPDRALQLIEQLVSSVDELTGTNDG